MKGLALWVGVGAAIGVALLAVLILAVPYLFDLPKVQAMAAASASQALGRPVRFASVSVRLWPVPRVELRGLTVADDPRFGASPFVTLERGFLSLRLRPLLAGRLEFGELRLEQPRIRLVEAADGTLNVASLGVLTAAAGSPPPVIPGRESHVTGPAAVTSLPAAGVVIEGGTVTFVSRGAGLREYRFVDLDLRLHGDGSALAVNGRATLTPGDAVVQFVDVRLARGGHRLLADAPISGGVSVAAADLRPLLAALAQPDLGVSGPLQGDFTLGGVLGAPHAAGRVQLARTILSRASRGCRPPERTLGVEDVDIPTRWVERTLLARPLTARVAGGDVTANLSATLDGDLHLVVSDIAVHGLSLERVLVEFLCHGYAVTGHLDLEAALTLRIPGAPGSMSGDGRFQIGRGRVVGARALQLFGDVVKAADLAAVIIGEKLPSPFEFESITGSYQLRSGVATTRDLVYTGRGFTATASGEYALATGRLDADIFVQHRREQVRARVTGTAEAPVLHVDAGGALRAVGSEVERGLQKMLRRFR